MLKSSGAMSAATLISRLLGMVREMVYARFMGDTVVAGAFMLAFTVPNLFRRLLGEGALTAAFIPVFKEKEKLSGEAEMWRAANAVISGLFVVSLGVVVVGVLGVTALLALGSFYGENPAHAGAAAHHVPVSAAGVCRGGVHGDAQRAGVFLHPGDGGGDAQPGHDRVGALAGAAHGSGLGTANIWTGVRGGHRRGGAGFLSSAPCCTAMDSGIGGYRPGGMPPFGA